MTHSIFLFILGAGVGSFLNASMARFNTNMIGNKRSMCFCCGSALGWRELIPILSFLFQRGRCRTCSSKFSWRYIIVEILTGTLFVLVGLQELASLENAIAIMLIAILMAIALYDLQHTIIPDLLVFPLIALGFFFSLYSVEFNPSAFIGSSMFYSGLILWGFFLSLWALSRGRWMGFGDVKLALGLGLFLPLSEGITAIMFAFWIGAFYALVAMGIQKLSKRSAVGTLSLKSEIPFGPFMILGFFLVYFSHVSLFVF